MSTVYIGQLLLASFNFAPKNFAFCNGQLLAISSNQALFSLLGTTYGGNGVQNFALPNLQGRTPIGFGGNIVQGQAAGEDSHTLTLPESPQHTHALHGTSAAAGTINPNAGIFATTAGPQTLYAPPNNLVAMSNAAISSAGGSVPHENRQPFLVMNWCIALYGVFPSRS
jgi:microcystin-dependent protein